MKPNPPVRIPSPSVRSRPAGCGLRLKFPAALCLAGTLALVMTGCRSIKDVPHSGFLSSYSELKEEGGRLVYRSPELKQYKRFMVDPVQLQVRRDPPVLKPGQAAEVARFFRESAVEVLTSRGFQLSDHPDVGVARVRIALTEVHKSKWFLNLHPATKVTGLGVGSASMEAEVIDSITGKQLAAAIKTGRGNQFELDTFSRLDDVKDVIKRWAREAGDRLDEMHNNPPR